MNNLTTYHQSFFVSVGSFIFAKIAFKISRLILITYLIAFRVCYIFGGLVKDPVTEITHTFLTSNVLSTLRQVDAVAFHVLSSSNCVDSISQMPVVLIPVHFDRDAALRITSCQRSVVLRPFITNDFMTGTPALPGKHLPLDVVSKMYQEISSVQGISRVLYDLTTKPPGTTEWE